LTDERDTLNSSYAAINSQITTLADERVVLSDGLNTLNTQLVNLNNERTSVQDNLSNLNNQLTTLNDERTNLLSGLDDLTNDLNTLTAERTNLEDGLAALENGLTSLNSERTSLTDNLNSLNTHLSDLNDTRTNLKANLTGLNAQLSSLNGGRANLQTNLSDLQSQRATQQAIADGQDVPIANQTPVRDNDQGILNNFKNQLNVANGNMSTFLAKKNSLINNLATNQSSINTSADYINDYLTHNGYSVSDFSNLDYDIYASDNDSGVINLASLSINSANVNELNGQKADFTFAALTRLDAAIAEVAAWTPTNTETSTNTKTDTMYQFYSGQKLFADTVMAREELLSVENQIETLDKLKQEKTNLEILSDTLNKHNKTMESLAVGFMKSSVNLTEGYINSNPVNNLVRNFGTRAQVGSYNVGSNFQGRSGFGAGRFA
jgi:chromosome segregation ATPase